jgi:succinate dehydrogenase / fumarate reductase membrane anchor subunit
MGMVTAVTSFGRSGLYDWVAQRVSAVVLAAYAVFIAGYIILTPDVQYGDWKALFECLPVRVFSLAALISIAAHAWIGLWAVLTDYLTTRLMGDKATVLRILCQAALAIVNITYVVWGIEIIWGI